MSRWAFLPLLIASPAFAQAQEPDIVVTGRGLDPGLGEQVFDTLVIDRERLSGSASNRLEDVLRDVPGFQLFRRSDARSANPTSQGATLRALGGNASSRALLILDGVPQADPFGGWVSWPAYDPRRLGEARVTRGGGSGVHGSGALAGTIELISATPAQAAGPTAGLAHGGRDSLDAHAGIGLGLGAGFVTVSGAYARGDGFVPVVEEQRGPVDRPSPYEQASLALRAVAPLAGTVELQANGLAFTDSRERGTAFSGIRTRGADASLRLVGRDWSALAYVQTRDFYNSFAGVGAGRASVARVSEQYDVPSTGLGARGEWRPRVGGRIELRLGGDWRETRGVTRERFAFQNGVGTRGRVAGGRIRTLGGFAEAAWSGEALTLTAGGRVDRWRIEDGVLRERVLASGAVLADTAFPDRSGWEPTGRAGFAWRPAPALTLRGAAYLGWRLPTLNELYRPFRIGADTTAANAALAPERLHGAEAGLEWRPAQGARIGATAFVNRLEGAIANVTVGAGGGGLLRQRQNLEAISTRGVEVDGRIEAGRWSLSAGWSWVAAEVEAGGAALPLDGLRPAQTPRHSGSASLAWADGRGARASLTARYVGSQYEDDLNAQLISGAFTLDAAGSFRLAENLAVETRAENLTGARLVSGIAGDGTIERATPRLFWIGIRVGG
jgi:vitamin B12 transporter